MTDSSFRMSVASPFKSSLSTENPFKGLSYDLVKTVLDMTEFKYADLKDLTKGFPTGSYHRADMEYRTETQRLLEERYTYYLKCVKRDGWILKIVPMGLCDREMCLEAVKNVGWALQYVPWKLRDREMCLEAVKIYGDAMRYVPEELRDREMYLESVKTFGWTLQLVPEELRDEIRAELGL